VHNIILIPNVCSFLQIAVEAMATELAFGNSNCKTVFAIVSV
jgi:hypothetical protein